MSSPILTRRRWLLKAHGSHIVIVKGTNERFTHPLLKAFLWALYIPRYPHITVEVRIADRYKPDVIAFDPSQALYTTQPSFWGEAGQVGADKIAALVRRYPDTHFAVAKWETSLSTFAPWIRDALRNVKRRAPFDIINVPDRCADLIDSDGNIHITFADVQMEQV
jgi:hypothetical protein